MVNLSVLYIENWKVWNLNILHACIIFFLLLVCPDCYLFCPYGI